jgi:quercetin dioxygenase-like cupin family protein
VAHAPARLARHAVPPRLAGEPATRGLVMRKTVLFSLAATAVLILAPSELLAQDMTGHAMRSSELKWGPAPPVLPKGGQVSVLAGDPTKEGLFVLRLKAPAGYKIPAHNHPTDELVTVISGTSAIGMGDKLDEAKADKMKPGDFINLGKGMNHFAVFPEETIVEIASMGPYKITYVNKADDPQVTQ